MNLDPDPQRAANQSPLDVVVFGGGGHGKMVLEILLGLVEKIGIN